MLYYNTVELHLSGFTRTESHPDVQKFWILDFLKIGNNDCYYLQYVPASKLSTTPGLKFWESYHSTVIYLITGNFKQESFVEFLTDLP